MNDAIFHVGVKRRSGRYGWGTGENPYQHEPWFRWGESLYKLRSEGLTDKEIAKVLSEEFNLKLKSSGDIRAWDTIYKNQRTRELIAYANHLRNECDWSNTAIAARLGVSEGTVRNYLKPGAEENSIIVNTVADKLREDIKNNKFVDIGVGIEANMGISKERLRAAVKLLEAEGYRIYDLKQNQAGTGNSTSIKMIGIDDPNKTSKENWNEARQAFKNGEVYIPSSSSEDGGRTFQKIEKPVNIDSSRIQIRYAEDGGTDRDGLIEIRRGATDLNMGNRLYCQARIAVDGTHYLKGMVVYSDDLPKGVDIRFNTNKSKDVPLVEVLKKQSKGSETNPFGAAFKQHYYIDENGEKKLSAINIVNDEESWGNWRKALSSQMLSKQRWSVAESQLKIQQQIRETELKDIMSITNPMIKQKLLRSFADSCDSDAAHLQAAPMPGQKTSVLLPSPDIKKNEIYAPNFNNGDKVVLIRHPHGGVFEIPELTVNNSKNSPGRKMIDRSDAAVVIHPDVAKVLSGADFDGDTVLVIPNNKGQIRRESPLKQLENFDPQSSYPGGEKIGLKEVGPNRKKGQDGFQKQREMGVISNLITDMTIKGADRDELARAVRHSMVIIDAEKHQLDWKTSEKDNRIDQLKEKYQNKKTGGSSTIISRAKSPVYVNERDQNRYKIDPKTGNVEYFETKKTKRTKDKNGEWTDALDKDGNPVYKQQKIHKMDAVDDAYALVDSKGKYRIETVYADHANAMKKLAKQARIESTRVGEMKREPSAAKVYSKEVADIKEKIRISKTNAPLERKAQALAEKMAKAQIKSDPDKYPEEDYEARKKLKGRCLQEARDVVGAKKQRPNLTEKEWTAINAGAITKTALSDLVKNMDDKELKELAMPRSKVGLSSAQKSRAKSLWATGYTQAEIAQMLGVSPSAISNVIKE